ncbi:TPA: hypothetical protein ACIA0S_004097 [Salmonella enterica subsp. houtenae serovar [1],40:z4,z23:-]|nr:hypothetical protein [Salmonella enterica]HAU3348312.1 hypothetical protein [Salmonella enterica subsp. houtenae]
MPLAARLNDQGTQHDGYHETVITGGSPTVYVDGLPTARMGDPLTPHDKPKHPTHPPGKDHESCDVNYKFCPAFSLLFLIKFQSLNNKTC